MNIPGTYHGMFIAYKNMEIKFIRKVVKNGRNSYYINIPREIARDLKIKERQKLIIKAVGKKLVISDWK